MDFLVYFNIILPYIPFLLLFIFHVFIRPKLSLVRTLSYVITWIPLVPVISAVTFAIYKLRFVFLRISLLPGLIICFVLCSVYLLQVDLHGYHLLGICLSLIVVLRVLQYNLNRYMVSKLKWIRRECRLLDAVCKDISKALQVGAQISIPNPEMIKPPLSESQIKDLEQWVESTEVLVGKANRIIKDLHAQMQFLLGRQHLFLHLNKVVSISNDVSSQIKESACVDGIYNKLENWLSMIQSLQDMVIEDESGSVNPRQLENQVITIIGEAIDYLSQDKKQNLGLKLVLLEAFLNDLRNVRLETAIEKTWLEEIKYCLDGIENAFDNFSQRNNGSGKELDREVGWMADGLTELLEAKMIFGFQFTIIQQQPEPHQNDDVNNGDLILSVVNKIRNQPVKLKTMMSNTDLLYVVRVAEAVAEVDPEIESLCKKLENMHKQLKAIDTASSFKSVCLQQMTNIGSELEKAFQKYFEDTHPVRLETSRIESPIKDLETFIKAHNYKVRPKYRSIIGLVEDADALISKLTSTAGSEQCCIFSIVGMQGIGKSTLAKKVYLHREISGHFQIRRWVYVPNIPNNNDAILKNVGNQIITTDESQQDQEDGEIEVHYSQKVHNFLKQKRCLVVLDNVPTMEVWNVIRELFPKEGTRSRILLTTRDMTLASQVDYSGKPHQLRLRTKEESWELFLEKAQLSTELLSQNELLVNSGKNRDEKLIKMFLEGAQLSTELLSQNELLVNSGKNRDEKLIKKAKQVVESCWGLPSIISLIGTLFVNTVESDWLSRAVELVNQCQTLWPETLQISSLPDNLTSLLSYFSLFPKNCIIPARRLIALWVAEELVQSGNDKEKTAENIAEDCLLKLIGLNIIQPVENKVPGKVSTCRLPDPLRDAVLSLARITFSGQMRLADHYEAGFKLIHGVEQSADELRKYENVLSLISFDFRKGDKPGKDIGNFLRKGIANGCFKNLKVLDLERVFRPQLRKSIGKLTELKYLGLRWTYLEKIPSDIGNLSKLQTLDLRHTYIRTLPVTIWKLQDLRHLYLNQTYRSKFVHQSKTKSLDNLQTLWGVFLDKNSPLRNRLDELKSLRKLELAFQLSTAQQQELATRICKLEHLQSLRLMSVDVMSAPQSLYLGNFSRLKSLSNMYLFGRLGNALSSSAFPYALSDLTLSSSGLEYDPMPILERFPNLKSLCLFSESFTRERMVCSRGGFSQLLVLKMWKLGSLTDWTIEDEAMQNLKELEIRCCPLLRVPDGLKHLKTLRQLKLRNMSEAFRQRCSVFIPLSTIDAKTLLNQD